MHELISLIPKLISKAYSSIHKGLYNTPITTFMTLVIISSISFGSAYIGLVAYVEFNKQEAYVILDNANNECSTSLK